jgi:hypothetical protein
VSGLFHLKRLGVYHPWQRPLLAPVRYDDFTRARSAAELAAKGPDRPRYVQGTVTAPLRPILGGNRFLAEIRDTAGETLAVEGERDDMEAAGRELGEAGQTAHLIARVHRRAKGGAYLTEVRSVPAEWRGRVRPAYPYPARLRIQPDPEATIRNQILSALGHDLPDTEGHVARRMARYRLSEDNRAAALAPFPDLVAALRAMHLPAEAADGWAAQAALDRLGRLLELVLLVRPWAEPEGGATAPDRGRPPR